MHETGLACPQVHLLGPPHLVWLGNNWDLPGRQVRITQFRRCVQDLNRPVGQSKIEHIHNGRVRQVENLASLAKF